MLNDFSFMDNWENRFISATQFTPVSLIYFSTLYLKVSLLLTCNLLSGSNFLAKPKSIILIRFPSCDRQSIFSGFKSKCSMLLRCMNSIASQTCRMNTTQTRSVRTNSSSMTRSKSSPPSTLWK